LTQGHEFRTLSVPVTGDSESTPIEPATNPTVTPSGPAQILGHRPQMTRRSKIWTPVAVLLMVCLLIWAIVRERWSFAVFFPAYMAILIALQARPRTVVNPTGIHRPFRRRSLILWSTVDTISAPAPEFPTVRVNLINGPTISLHDIPTGESAAVAAIGGKQIARPEPTRFPPPSPARRTDQDIEADVTRRAKALAEERAALELRNPRLRRQEPPSSTAHDAPT